MANYIENNSIRPYPLDYYYIKRSYKELRKSQIREIHVIEEEREGDLEL